MTRVPVPRRIVHGRSYEAAARAAIDLGGDTDTGTAAAVTGTLAGAVYGITGIPGIPARWTEPLHVPLPGFGERVPRTPESEALARGLVTR